MVEFHQQPRTGISSMILSWNGSKQWEKNKKRKSCSENKDEKYEFIDELVGTHSNALKSTL